MEIDNISPTPDSIQGFDEDCVGNLSKDYLFISYAELEFPRLNWVETTTSLNTNISGVEIATKMPSRWPSWSRPQGPTTARFFCGKSLDSAIVRSSPSNSLAVFMIKFKSDSKLEVPMNEIGFQMLYTVF